MNELKAIKVIPKNGNEHFLLNNNNLGFKLSEFWSWSQSDLLSNTLRGVLAEYIVKQDLIIKSNSRTEWDAYDLLNENGLRIEIKSSAYLQSWEQKEYSKISFDIAPTKGWNAKTNEYSNIRERQSDYYVFCLLHHKNKETVNPIQLDQWTFYVINTRTLNEKKPKQKSITLNSLLKLNPKKCKFGEIRNFIK